MNTTEPIYRSEDNELLGYVKQNGTKWDCLTIFGCSFDSSSIKQEAMQIVQSKGLGVLTKQWQYFDKSSKAWHACVIIEASKNSVRVAPMDGYYPDTSKAHLLTGSLNEILRLH